MTSQSIERKAESLGITIDRWENNNGTAFAPRGKVFASTGTHAVALTHSEPYAPKGKWSESMAGLLEDMEHGLIPCIEPDCDVCNEETS